MSRALIRRASHHAASVAVAALLAAPVPAFADSIDKVISEARKMMAHGDVKGAMINLKKAVKDNPDNGEARFELGNTELLAADYAAAERNFETARAKGYPAEKTLPRQAVALLAQNKYDKLAALPHCPENLACKAEVLATQARAAIVRKDKDVAAADIASRSAIDMQPDNQIVQLARAYVLLALEDFGQAEQLVDKILASAPNLPDALMLKGDLRRQAADYVSAEDYFSKTLAVSPRLLSARIQLALTKIAQNKMDEAYAELNKAQNIAPKAPLVLYLKGMLLARTDKMAEALETVRPVEAEIANEPQGVFLLALIHFANNDLEAALQYAARYHNLAPDNLPGTKLLANIAFRLRDFDKTISLLGPVQTLLSTDSAALDVLGSAYLATGKVKEANEALAKSLSLRPNSVATKGKLAVLHTQQAETMDVGIHELEDLVNQNPGQTEFGLALISTLFGAGQYEKAIEAATKLIAKEPANPLPYSLRASSKLAMGNKAGAEADFSMALVKDPDFVPALTSLADMDVQAGNINKARARLDTLLERKPADVPTLLARAQIENQINNQAGMIPFLQRALEMRPDDLEAHQMLLRALTIAEPAKAVAAASELARSQSRRPSAVGIAVQTLLRLGKVDETVALLKKLEDDVPNESGLHIQVGQILARLNRLPDAAQAFDRAIAISPTSIPAWIERVQTEFKSHGLAPALALAAKAIQTNPSVEILQLLPGDLRLQAGNIADAEAFFRQTLAQTKSPLAMAKLFRAIATGGDLRRAETTMQEWLASHPDDLNNKLMLADAHLISKDYKEAVKQYEALAVKLPRNSTLFNNLAVAYDHLNDPRALETAQKAFRFSQGNFSVADTYGYLLLRKGNDLTLATQLLSLAFFRGGSDDPTIAYHFARALAEKKDIAGAKAALKPALDSGAVFDEAEEARQFYAKLGR